MGCSNAAALRVSGGLVTGVDVPVETESVPPPRADGSHVNPAELSVALDRVHRAGMPGIYAEVRDADQVWRGASGVADVETGQPVEPDMLQRVGSITKAFTAAAVMQQVENGRIRLDAPIGDQLPQLVPGERGKKITVRMLLNHTSGLADYLPTAFPSLAGSAAHPGMSPESLDDNRFKTFRATELIEMGLSAPGAGEPGDVPGTYSNTNYLLLGQLLEQLSGMRAEAYITQNVIERAGLRQTRFPAGARLEGRHSRMYEALHGLIDPPRDYSVYDMSWVGTAAALVSTTEDLNRFYRELLDGRIVRPASLAEMQQTVPVYTALYREKINYGLGLHRVEIPGGGTFWGHDGTTWGALTLALIRADGQKQLSVAMNLVRWNTLDGSGHPRPDGIDAALSTFYQLALRGAADGTPTPDRRSV